MLLIDALALCYFSECAFLLITVLASLVVALGFKLLMMSTTGALPPVVAPGARGDLHADQAAGVGFPAARANAATQVNQGAADDDDIGQAARDEPPADVAHDTFDDPGPHLAASAKGKAKARAGRTAVKVSTPRLAECQRQSHTLRPGRNAYAVWLHCCPCNFYASWRWNDGRDWVTYPDLVDLVNPLWEAWTAQTN